MAFLTGKTEGTSQTFGQMVIFPSRGDLISAVTDDTGGFVNVTPLDTAVRVVQDADTLASIATAGLVSDSDKSSIALAAAATDIGKEAVVSIKSDNTNGGVSSIGLSSFANTKENIIDHAVVIGSVFKAKDEIKKILIESSKVDLCITLKSKESEAIHFNSLKTPEMESEFVYNFFDEEELNISTQEDPSLDPLHKNTIRNVPRYVEIRWNTAKLSEPLSTQMNLQEAEKELRKDTFDVKRAEISTAGASSGKDFESSKKNAMPLERDGIKVEVVDIHQTDKAFDATVNEKIFANSISAVLNTSDQKNVISSLPLFEKILFGSK